VKKRQGDKQTRRKREKEKERQREINRNRQTERLTGRDRTINT
jgi:hypothetical protein